MSLTPHQVLAELPTPVQVVVFGQEVPQMDIPGMRLLAASWRTVGNALGDCNSRLTKVAAGLALEGNANVAISDALRRDAEHLSESHRLCHVMADYCDQAATDSEKALWSMAILGLITTQQVMVAMGSSGILGAVPVLAAARSKFLLMLDAFIARLATGAAAQAALRTGTTLAGFAALPAGVDLAVQGAQIAAGSRKTLDWASVTTALASGAGSTMAGFVGGRVAFGASRGATLGMRHTAVALTESGAGVLGGVLAVAPIAGFPTTWEEIGTSVVSGTALGLAGARAGGGRPPESQLEFGRTNGDALGPDTAHTVLDGNIAEPGAGEHPDIDRAAAADPDIATHPPSEPDPDAEYRLTEAELRHLFEVDVAPAIFEGVRPVAAGESPDVVVAIAQTGAGKSTLIRQLHSEYAAGDGLAHLTVNQMFRFHPRYAELLASGDPDPVGHIVPEAKAWFQMALDHAIGQRFNVAVEETFKSPERVAETVTRFARADYAATVDILAVPGSVSRLSMIRRFALGEDEYMPAAVHDRSYGEGTELVDHLKSAAGSDIARLRIRTRSEVVFDEPLDSPNSARPVLEQLRTRPWSPTEQQEFLAAIGETRRITADAGREARLDIATVDKMWREIDDVMLAAAPQLSGRWSTAADSGGPMVRSPAQSERFGIDPRLADPVGPARPPKSGRLRILLLNDEWNPEHGGGVTVLNRNLAGGFAAAGHEVFVRVGHDVTGNEGGDSITVLGPRDYRPDVDRREQMTTDLDTLPDGIDMVIAHSRHTGYAGRLIQGLRYPDATLVHLVHTDSGAFGTITGDPERGAANERKESVLISTADIVVGPGPVLTRYAGELADQVHATPLVHELVPGLDFSDPIPPPDPGGPYNLMVFGRIGDNRKGVADAADMVRLLNERGVDVTLTVRGAPPETVSRTELLLSQRAGRSVTVLPHTRDPADILADLHRTHLVLMPSRAESFGLVATESLAAGVPVLVPDTSGAGGFLADPARFPPELTADLLVPQDYTGPVPVQEWADRIAHQLQHQETAWRRAGEVRQALLDGQVTWQSAAESLVHAARQRR